jgi:ATP-dependent DNA ligase
MAGERSPEIALPDWVTPMAATLTQERFTGPEWVFERKFDGIRLLAFKQRNLVRLLSRNQLPQHLPSIADAIAALPPRSLILDGEDLRSSPLEQRRAALEHLSMRAPLARVERLTAQRPWEQACAEGWEGVIAKRVGSVYESRRSRNWLKMKCEVTAQFVVGGFTDPQGRRVGLGALLVGQVKDHELLFAGKVGTGFDSQLLQTLRRRFGPIEVASSPFTRGAGLPRIRAHWVKPEVVVEVAFIEWTVHGKLRHPRFLHLIE